MIPYSCQSIDEGDIEAVIAVLRSDWLTQGPAVPSFEAALGAVVNARHTLAVSSGTAGLHLACLALGIEQGDSVWTSPLSFVASANCARLCGATVDFVDAEPETGLISISALEQKLDDNLAGDTSPKALIVTHYAGHSADMSRIAQLAKNHGFKVIEDAAHALGACYDSKPVGECEFSDLAVFSFHPLKHITTGEGGCICTNSTELARRIERLRSHGITRVAAEMDTIPDGDWFYQQIELGLNYRMSDIQAALGHSQLERLPAFLTRRRQLADRYQRLLGNTELRTLPASEGAAWHLFPILVEPARRKEVFDHLRRSGIGVNVHYLPIHLHPDYRKLGFAVNDFPGAEHYYARTISLPLHPRLTDSDQDFVVTRLKEVLS